MKEPRTARVVFIVLLIAGPAYAQTTDRPVRRVEVTAGGGLFGGAALGSSDANLRANDTTRRPFRLFSSETRFGRAALLEARAGYSFNRRVAVEIGVALSQPEIRSSTSNDAEGAPALTIVERIDQYFVEGSLIFTIDELSIAGRTVPFVAVGGGYVRQLHEGLTFIEQGRLYHLGGGIKHWLVVRERGFIRAAGLRADARVYVLTDGIAFEDRPRPHGAISGGVFVTF